MTNCSSDDREPDYEIEKATIPGRVGLANDDLSPNSAPVSSFTSKSHRHWNNKSNINHAEIESNRKYPTKVYEAFTLEEIASSDLEQEDAQQQIIKPDEYEEADSIQSSGDEFDEDSDIASGIRRLSCQDEPRGLTEEQISRYVRKKKKWRARLFKRRRSSSFGDEVDMTDSVKFERCEVDRIHRRLRRRIDDPDEENLILERNTANVHLSDLDGQMEIEE